MTIPAYAYPELTIFDKLNLARCAQTRAELNVSDGDRFSGEYSTAKLWMRHTVAQTHTLAGKPVGYNV